jgi:phosphoserine phosphatase
MLERVKCPVAVNPKKELAPIATKKGWAAVTFRHDVPRRIASLVDWGC